MNRRAFLVEISKRFCLTGGGVGIYYCKVGSNIQTSKQINKGSGKMRTYKSQEFAKLVGLPYRTLMSWCETGLIQPHSYEGRRRVQTYFSNKDLREVRLIKTLRRRLSGQELRKAVNYLRDKLGHNPFSSGEFLVISGDLVKVCKAGQVRQAVSTVKESGQLMILDCLELEKEYRREKV